MAGRAAASRRAGVSYLTQKEAQAVDQDLMGSMGYAIETLMELAGLSCAAVVHKVFPPRPAAAAATSASGDKHADPDDGRRILLVAGPGNNGGDALVCARHLYHFGYAPVLVYPKRPSKPLYQSLTQQCLGLRILLLDALPEDVYLPQRYLAVVDGIFGFSFSGSVRAPFDKVLAALRDRRVPPIVSIDIPSGWNVETGNADGVGLEPAVLISLTAPKLCAKTFTGRHFLGGRFVPPDLVERYRLELPVYPGAEQCVEL